jgi:hypothetical protein
MDVGQFRREFWTRCGGAKRNEPSEAYWYPEVRNELDLCPDVEGMLSIKKQQLINLGYGKLAEGEAYLEVGTFQGKSLVSAMLGNPPRSTFACDNFSEFDVNSLSITECNLRKYGLRNQVVFYDCDFRKIYDAEHLPEPLGFYFYDGAHDEESQYLGIKLAEPFLADEALVFVDDWRLASDSGSYAEAGTMRAVAESTNTWQLMYELPARMNGDRALWWNGLGVLSFKRTD